MNILYESWESESAKFYVYNHFPLDENAILLDSKKGLIEANIYKLGDLVIKQRKVNELNEKVCKECINREYKIGLILNKLQSPHLMKTIGYFETEDDVFLVTNYVKGDKAVNFNKKYTYESKESYLLSYHMTLIIRDLQEQISFNHNDLHEHNVIIETTEERRYNYFFNGKQHSIISPFAITIIDFGRSYVDGISEGYYDGIISPNITPGIYDPIVDLAFLSVWNPDILYDVVYTKNSKLPLFKMLEDENIIEESGEVVVTYPRVLEVLVGNYKVWATNKSNGLSVKEVVSKFIKYLFKLREEYNISFDSIDPHHEIDEIDDEYEINLFLAERISHVFEIPEEELEYFRKEIGKSLVTEKKEMIKKRNYYPLFLYQTYTNDALNKIKQTKDNKYLYWVGLISYEDFLERA